MHKGPGHINGLKYCTNLNIFLFLVAAGLISYSTSLLGKFVYDDYAAVVNNPAIRDIFHIRRFFDTFNTRFLAGVSFSFNYWLHGLNTFGYHILNVLLHAAGAFFVYCLVLLTCQTPGMKEHNLAADNRIPALFSALIFLTHPLATEAVSFITQRALCLAAFFYLLTLVFYAKSRLLKDFRYQVAAVLSAVCCSLSKEIALTLPLMVTAYELFFFGFSKKDTKETVYRLLPFYLTAVMILLLLNRDSGDFIWNFKDQVFTGGGFQWTYFLTYVSVLCTYLRLFILPVNQNIDYDYALVTGLFDPRLLVSAAVLLSVLTAGVWLFKRNRLLSFCVAWFFIAVLAEWASTSVVHYAAGVMYEHWAYLPLVGFAVFLPMVFLKRVTGRKLAVIVLCCLVGIFSVLTFQRNKVWQNELSLWHDAALKSPRKATSFFGLASAYSREGMNNEAVLNYQKSISLQPVYPEAYNNLGIIYQVQGQLKEAKEFYEKAVSLNPGYARAYHNLGVLYEAENNKEKAIELYQKAVELKPNYVKGYKALGFIYARLGRFDEAMKYFEKAIHIDPQAAAEIQNTLESVPR